MTARMLTSLLAVCAVGGFVRAASPPAETLVPPTACGFFSSPNWPKASAAFDKTAVGQLLNSDPAMKPFIGSATGKLNAGEVVFRWLPGLTPNDVRDVATGEVAVAVFGDDKTAPGVVVLIDTADNAKKADAFLDTFGKRLTAAGAKAAAEKVNGATVYALPAEWKGSPFRACAVIRQGDWVVIGSGADVVAGVLDRLSGKEAKALAADDAFTKTTAAVQKELGDTHLRVFVRPMPFLFTARTLSGEAKPAKNDKLDAMQKEGFDGLKGLGVAIRVGDAEHDLIARGKVYTPEKLKLSARVLDFPNAALPDPPAWVPATAGSATAVSVDFVKAFQAFAGWVDATTGDGEKGVFDATLDGLKMDPDGPQVDVKRSIVGVLKSPVWMASLRPAEGPQQSVTGIGIPGEPAMAQVLKKLFDGDKEVKAVAFGDHGAWQLLPKKKKEQEPRPTLGAGHGSLFVTDTPEGLKLLNAGGAKLADDDAYKATTAAVGKLVGGDAAARGFVRVEEWGKDVWAELARADKPAAKAKTPTVASVLKNLFAAKDGADKPAFDFTQLPAFAKVRARFTGRAGFAVTTQPDGWSFALLVSKP